MTEVIAVKPISTHTAHHEAKARAVSTAWLLLQPRCLQAPACPAPAPACPCMKNKKGMVGNANLLF